MRRRRVSRPRRLGSPASRLYGRGLAPRSVAAVVENSRFDKSHPPYDTGDHVDVVQVLGTRDDKITNNYVTTGGANSAGARVWNNVAAPTLVVEDGVAEDYNLTPHINRSPSSHTIVAPVTFEADYELPACSPGIDSADPAFAPALDLLDRSRLAGPDRGARERMSNSC